MKVLIIILGVLVVLCLLMLVFVRFIFEQTYKAFNIDPQDEVMLYHFPHYEKLGFKREPVEFDSLDGNRLTGYIYDPENEPKGLIVFSHGIWSGPEEYLILITWLVRHGWKVFTYNYTAYNGSQGKSAKGLPQSPLDLHAALNYIEANPELNKYKKVLLGHSWGAYATSAVLNYDHDVCAACSMSGFNDPLTISVEAGKQMFGPVAGILKPFINIVNHIRFGSQADLTAVDGINKSGIPVLLSHGTGDDFIVYNVSSIVCHKSEITNPNVQYITFDEEGRNGHNNFFGTAESEKYLADIMADVKEMQKHYPKGKIPHDVKVEYIATKDRDKVNQPNEQFYAQIDEFFSEAVG